MPSLSEGYVPITRIRELLDAKFDCAGVYSTDDPALQPLLRMWDYHDRLWKTLNGTGDGRGQLWMHFDVADKVLCLLGLQLCWYEELRDVYYSVNLDASCGTTRVTEKGERRCAREGCSETFAVERRYGKYERRFCSSRCQRTDYERRVYGKGRTLQQMQHDTCPRGHDWSEENTYVNSRGSKECRACKRERMRERRAALAVAA